MVRLLTGTLLIAGAMSFVVFAQAPATTPPAKNYADDEGSYACVITTPRASSV